MKKFIITALVLTLSLLILPPNSLAKGGNGALVIRNEGPIEGLMFEFNEPLPVDLGDLSVSVEVVEVVSSGREITIITPKGQYIYHANLDGGQGGLIYAYTQEFPGYPLVFAFDSARLFERFQIDGPIPQTPEEVADVVVPDDVNLFFRVRDAVLIGEDGSPAGAPFNLMFRIRRGDLTFIHIW